jgi:hypothetical protein
LADKYGDAFEQVGAAAVLQACVYVSVDGNWVAVTAAGFMLMAHGRVV